MTDSMKFGPEWLRNLSSEGSTGGAPKYQLAEHRYGREEMLALCDRNVRAPDSLVKIQGLYIDKTQTPMALLSMTEEETRQWNRGINSDAVLRLAGKAPLGPPSGIRGRGGSVDRGRGRGGRLSGGFHYTRGIGYDEQSEGGKEIGPPERGFSRGSRSFDRSQGGERSWSERNGGDSGDWNGSTSPRKEFSSSKDYSGGGRRETDSWRRHRGSSEEEESVTFLGWRKTEKWGRSNSWRDESDVGDNGLMNKGSSRTSSWGRGWADEAIRSRGYDDDSLRRGGGSGSGFMDEVPEWAMENPSESGGCFDATGAFHGGSYSDEEEENIDPRPSRSRVSDDQEHKTKPKSPPLARKHRDDYDYEEDEFEEQSHLPKDRKLSRSQTAQGNLVESSAKSSPAPMSKSRSSSNLKSEPPEVNPPPSKRTESQNFDRLRVQHQNFIDKSSTNKEISDSDEGNDVVKKKEIVEPDCVSEEVLNNEANVDIRVANGRDNNSRITKDTINKVAVTPGVRLQEEETDRGTPVNRQGSEEDMEGMAEVVKDTVVKLFEDEEKTPVNVDNDKWYYRDPQGVVQGPFRSSEMLEWFMNGYFQLSLLLRRERDEVYVKLGDLMQKCGKVPFLPGINFPVLKADSDIAQASAQAVAQPPPPPPPPPPQPQHQPPNLTQPDLLVQQYHQYQILQKQILLSQHLALSKLSQSDMWNTLSPLQQRNLLMQKLNLPQPPVAVDQLAQVDKNPLSQLISQMQQNKVPMAEARESANSMDPIRQLLQQMSIMQTAQMPMMAPPLNPTGVVLNHHLAQQAHLNPMMTTPNLSAPPPMPVEENKVDDPIQSLLRQLGNQTNIMPHPAPTDSLWGAPACGGVSGRPQSWGQGSQPVASSSTIPLWEIKTEQQILAEQQLRLEEERKKEELRKFQEEEAEKQKELEEKRRDEKKVEDMKKLEKKLLEEAKARQQQKNKEEKKKAEEMKKKQEEMLKKKQQEELKKQEEAQRKKEEKEKKKEEERERKRLVEEEKKRAENERRKKEEEMLEKKQEEEEEAARRQEQQKRQVEALRRLQEQQLKSRITTWSQPNVTTGTSLAEIQKMQKEKKQEAVAQQMAQQSEMQHAQLIRKQQAVVQRIAHQNEMQQIQRETESRSNGFNLKWAEKMPKVNQNVKSLAEIQAEEQLQLAKQLEKERLERLQQQRETSISSNAGIWASQTLTWNNNSSPWAINPPQQNSAPGFWDEVAPAPTKAKNKAAPSSPLKTKNQSVANQKQGNTNSGSNAKGSKSKPKKGEAAIMKLFEPLDDEFTSWCTLSLQSLQTDVDIPTFVAFLRDVESPYEVEDYVKLYFGDGKEAQEFAKEFIERRSRWRSAKKASAGEDDLCATNNPSTQYQSSVSQEFQEVKGKGKKSKKGKMLKVDNRILGFNVTAAQDRINIGDRDYVDHNS